MSSLNSPGLRRSNGKKRSKESVWDNFSEIVEANGNIKWKCNECGDKLSNHKTSVSRHCESKHRDKQQAAVKIGLRVPEGDMISKKRSVQVQNALSDVIAIPCLSINLLLHPLFQKLFHALNSKIQLPTSFCTLKGLLNNRCEKVRMQMKADLKNMPQRCSITCDVWSDKGLNNSYLVDVSLQWLDEGECENDEEDEEEYQYDNTLDLTIQSALSLRIGCFAHALQLVIMSMFKENFASHSGYRTFCALTNQFRHSTVAKELRQGIGNILQNQKSNSCKTRITWMKIFVDVLRRIQCEKSVTISRCYGYLKAIYKSVEKFKISNCRPRVTLQLEAFLNSRFDPLMKSYSSKFDPIFFVATALDPNTASIMSEQDYRTAVLSIQNMINIENVAVEDQPEIEYSLNSTLDQLLGEVATENRNSGFNGSQISANTLLEQMLNRVRSATTVGRDSIDALKYWSSFLDTDARTIASFALEVLTIPATSAPIERIFFTSRIGYNSAQKQDFLIC